MCDFFSFISDGSGKVYYADLELRKNQEFLKKYNPDSHTSLAAYFLKDPVADDKVNKYEYSNGEFKVDQINVTDDSLDAEKWINDFVETEEFQEICLEAVKRTRSTISNYVKIIISCNNTGMLCNMLKTRLQRFV